MVRHCSRATLEPRANLELFVERTEELTRTRIMRNQGLSNEWSISAGRNQPTVFRSLQPDEDDLRSYLLTFRKFISKDESIFIARVHGLCHKYFTSDELKGRIQDCQCGWKENVCRSGIRLTVDGKQVDPSHIADLWINGHYFHDDPEKAKELKRHAAGTMFVRHEFLNFIVEATRVIGATGYTIKMALRDGSVAC